jgi:thiol-disulfide isomerase/thioredoxin
MISSLRSALGLTWLAACAAFGQPSIVNSVRARIAQHDLAGAESLTRAFQARTGPSPQLAAAYSWLARAALEAKSYDPADIFAAEAGKMASRFLTGRKLDDDPWLPTAQGAAIEVHAQVLAARGQRAEAVQYLDEQSARFAGTSIGERIRKNINLLSLHGKRAPALEAADWLGPRPPALATLRGRPVLLFFWAHWCGDCKAMSPVLSAIQKTFAGEGLAVLAPTRLYGYTAGGEDAAPAKEKAYIEEVLSRYYPVLSGVPVPITAAGFLAYGASTTPTLVLIGGDGLVRYYHPGALTEPELAAEVRSALAKR